MHAPLDSLLLLPLISGKWGYKVTLLKSLDVLVTTTLQRGYWPGYTQASGCCKDSAVIDAVHITRLLGFEP